MKEKDKNIITKNYLNKIPTHTKEINWSESTKGIITLKIKNTGFANKFAQLIFKKPKVSQIHLDKFGSFIWPLIDGKRDITAIGNLVNNKFGSEAHPLYERLAKYFQIMDSYHFIEWVEH